MNNKDYFNDPFFTDPDYIKKARRRYVIASLVFFTAIGIFLYFISIKNNNKRQEIESMIGQSVILNKDTLMIIDYSEWNKTYTLANGREVGFELIDKLNVIK